MRGRQSFVKYLAGSFLAVAALLEPAAAFSTPRAAEGHPGTKVVGVLIAVEPSRVTILSGDGKQVTIETSEDFRGRVAIGSQVTAWYSSRRGANALEWMDTPRETFFVPVDQIRPLIRKVIILPKSDVPGAEGLFEAIERYLESHAGWYLASRLLAVEIRDRALKTGIVASNSRSPRLTLDAIDPATGEFDISRYAHGETQPQDKGQTRAQAQPQSARRAPSENSTLDAIDPATGQFDMTHYLRAEAQPTSNPQAQALASQPPAEDSLMTMLASETRVDAVLEVTVVEVQAPLSRLVAKWDGVEEPIAGKGSETIARLSLIPVRGAVPAATVVLKLWDSHGVLVWTNRTGLAVLAVREGLGDRLRERSLSEVLGNRAAMDKWLGRVFAPWLAESAFSGGATRKQ
jgi:hypothetical protein